MDLTAGTCWLPEGRFRLTPVDELAHDSARLFHKCDLAARAAAMGKPAVWGEMGIDGPVSTDTEDPALALDTSGLWLHKITWARCVPGGVYPLYCWTDNRITHGLHGRHPSRQRTVRRRRRLEQCGRPAGDRSARPVQWTLAQSIQPIVAAGRVLVSSVESSAFALGADDGATLWQGALPGPTIASAAVTGGLVVFACVTVDVVALDATDGGRRSTYDPQRSITAAPAVLDGLVLVATQDGRVWISTVTIPIIGSEYIGESNSGSSLFEDSPTLADEEDNLLRWLGGDTWGGRWPEASQDWKRLYALAVADPTQPFVVPASSGPALSTCPRRRLWWTSRTGCWPISRPAPYGTRRVRIRYALLGGYRRDQPRDRTARPDRQRPARPALALGNRQPVRDECRRLAALAPAELPRHPDDRSGRQHRPRRHGGDPEP